MGQAEKLVEALAAQAIAERDGELAEAERPEHQPKPVKDEGWWPRMGPIGRKLFDCTKRYQLAHGPRYSTKTHSVLNRLIRHCYEYDDALAVIAVMTRRSATQGGPWETLLQKKLPEWQEGMGLQGEGPNGEFLVRYEQGSQTPMIWIGTADGGWSRVILVSLMYGESIMTKIRNMAFSFFYFNELGQTDSEEFFTDPIQQLRREGVEEKIYIADMNPPLQGEDHWAHARFFKAENQENPDWYQVFFFPISENTFAPDVAEYVAMLKEKGKTDPTSWQRDGLGLWIKKPRGDGLFAKHFNKERHVRGDKEANIWMLPSRKWGILRLGFDCGPVNPSIVFFQNPPNSDGRRMYGVLDEIVVQRRPYRVIVQRILKRLEFWCSISGIPYTVQIVADASAFNQVNTDGRYDYRVIAALAEEELKKNAERYPSLGHIKTLRMVACPKPPGSRNERVSMLQAMLDADEIVVSAMCERVIAMLENAEEDIHLPGTVLKDRAGHIHVFDSLTYPLFFDQLGGRQPRTEGERSRAEMVEIG